ncbi:MAG: magnesium transporter MgtE N-terminal domain-containing protein [Acidimicrobiales bacterium]
MATPAPEGTHSGSPHPVPARPGADRPAHQRRRRARRILASEGVFDSIVSLAGIVGRPVTNQTGQEIGRLDDVVARWTDGQTYPPVTGLIIRVGRRLAFVPASAIDRIAHAEVLLRSSRLDLRDAVRRPDEVWLARDVLDHQLVDVDGVQVIRAADLYLAEVIGRIRLVGADVSSATLLRRLGPRRWRPLPTPDRVIDWAAIQPFSDAGDSVDGAAQVRLRTTHEGLHRLRPGELADLLEDLRRDERSELLAALSADEAADALEEMRPDDLSQLLREADPDDAARLLAAMEPDEAVDALRDLPAAVRTELLRRMPTSAASALRQLLGYPEDEAAGIMTTALVLVNADDTVSQVVDRLEEARGHDVDLDAVSVVDQEGRLIGDISLLTLLLKLRGSPEGRVSTLLTDEDVVTVRPHAPIDEVAGQLVEARRLSLVVVDDDGRPIGRILADDVLDALVPLKGRFHFPRLLT